VVPTGSNYTLQVPGSRLTWKTFSLSLWRKLRSQASIARIFLYPIGKRRLFPITSHVGFIHFESLEWEWTQIRFWIGFPRLEEYKNMENIKERFPGKSSSFYFCFLIPFTRRNLLFLVFSYPKVLFSMLTRRNRVAHSRRKYVHKPSIHYTARRRLHHPLPVTKISDAHHVAMYFFTFVPWLADHWIYTSQEVV